MVLLKKAKLKEGFVDMPIKDDISNVVNNGIDRMFPARRIARQAFLGNVAAPMVKARSKDVNAYDTAMEEQTKQNENNIEAVKKSYKDMFRGAVGMAPEKTEYESFLKDKDYEPINKSGGLPPIKQKSEWKTGGKISSASSRADGIAKRGKTRGKIV
jgi:hypothetical protein